jgi:hypothetical protein
MPGGAGPINMEQAMSTSTPAWVRNPTLSDDLAALGELLAEIDRFNTAWDQFVTLSRRIRRAQLAIVSSLTDLAAYRRAEGLGDIHTLRNYDLQYRAIAEDPGCTYQREPGPQLARHIDFDAVYRDPRLTAARRAEDEASERGIEAGRRFFQSGDAATDADIRSFAIANAESCNAFLHWLETLRALHDETVGNLRRSVVQQQTRLAALLSDMEPIARAVALLLDYDRRGLHLTAQEVASKVGVSKAALYRDDHFKATMSALKAKRRGTPPPRGNKDCQGNVEAWEDD